MPETSIVTCDCGTSVRLPVDREGRTFRCPKCKQTLAPAIDMQTITAVKLDADQVGALCQICQTATSESDDCVICSLCEQVHHRECWTEIGGCGTYGCKEAPQIEKSAAAKPLTAWGDTKKCPACAEEIKSIALKCRHCGTTFDTVDPMTAKDLKRQRVQSEQNESLKRVIVGLFVGSIIGCLAPIIFIACLALLVPQREKVKKCGPLHTTLAVVATMLSGLFSVLMVLFILFEIAT